MYHLSRFHCMDVKEMGKCCALKTTLDHNDEAYSRSKGKMSINYLRSLATFLGFTFSEPEPGDDVLKIDATIRADNPDWTIHNPQIDFQAKTTSTANVTDGYLRYEMSCEDLNKMRLTAGEHILVVLYLLHDPEAWVEDGEHGIQLHEQMYWYNPKSHQSDFEGVTTTLKIPVSNVINKRTLHHMMDIVGNGGRINDRLRDPFEITILPGSPVRAHVPEQLRLEENVLDGELRRLQERIGRGGPRPAQ